MPPLKDLISPDAVKSIAAAIKRDYKGFNSVGFLKGIEAQLKPLELKQRVSFVSTRLRDFLPDNPELAFPILVGALKHDSEDDIGISGFQVWPLTQYISSNGLKHFDPSMQALYAMTQRFTAEWDIRPFLVHHEKRTLKQLEHWVGDPNEHVRRLVSEGSRPLLPWGERLNVFAGDPTITWHLLEILKEDSSQYVRKSVANHINDHSKNHGEWVVKKLTQWKRDSDESNLDWIIRHSTRTLVKRGDTGALKLHGVGPSPLTVIKSRILTPSLSLGDTLTVEIVVYNPSKKPVATIIDNEIGLLKANGKHTPKVFKGRKLTIAAGDTVTVRINIPMRPVSVRKYYSGLHLWSPLINGRKFEVMEFLLKV